MSSLVVLLAPGRDQSESDTFAYATTPDGRAVARSGSATAALLPRATGAAAQVVAVVAAAALSWHRVTLPKGVGAASPRLRAVLDGLLEDHLLDEPASLHLAIEPGSRAATPAWVAACDRAWLRGRLRQLESAGCAVTRVVPELAPGERAALHAAGPAEQAELFLVGPDGVMRLPLSASATELAPESEHAPLFAEPGIAAEAERVLKRSAVLLPMEERLLQAAASPWELAQFDLASSIHSRNWKRAAATAVQMRSGPRWRTARWGAALLVAANLLGLNAWALKEHSQLQRKRDQLRSVLTETFPAVRTIVDVPLQMDRELAVLKAGSGAVAEGDLEPLLDAIASAAAPDRTPQGFEFTASELRLRGLDAAADGGQLIAALQSRGYQARVEGAVLVVRRASR